MVNFLTTTEAVAGAGMGSTMVMLVAMFAILYFMMIRPENKRKKEAERMRSAIKNGDQITTIGGIVGTVVNVKDDKIVIETSADQVRMELTKWAISTTGVQSGETPVAEKKGKKKEEEALPE